MFCGKTKYHFHSKALQAAAVAEVLCSSFHSHCHCCRLVIYCLSRFKL